MTSLFGCTLCLLLKKWRDEGRFAADLSEDDKYQNLETFGAAAVAVTAAAGLEEENTLPAMCAEHAELVVVGLRAMDVGVVVDAEKAN